MKNKIAKQRHGLVGPFIAMIGILLADQVTKWLMVEQLFRPEGYIPQGFGDWLLSSGERIGPAIIEILPFFNLVMVWNEGVSFGMFQNLGVYAPYILSAIALITIGVLLVWLYLAENKMMVSGLCLLIAGAMGNVLDRVRFGAVIDFIDFHAFGYHWPAFNIADSAITIGVILIIIETFLYKRDMSDMNQGSQE